MRAVIDYFHQMEAIHIVAAIMVTCVIGAGFYALCRIIEDAFDWEGDHE